MQEWSEHRLARSHDTEELLGERRYEESAKCEALMERDAGRKLAAEIYERSRPGYHSIARRTLDRVVREGKSEE